MHKSNTSLSYFYRTICKKLISALFFPQLYILAEGNCLFQGSVQDLIPYLATEGLVCPKYHNPADYSMYFQWI